MHARGPLLTTIATGLILTLGALLGLPGCGGGGGAAPIGLPVAGAAVLFPPGYATTPAETITVRGVLASPAGVLGVEVEGVAAVSTDGFATWTAMVPLTEGENDLDVSVLSAGGVQVEATVRIRREVLYPAGVSSAAYDTVRGVVYVLAGLGELVSIDLATGARTLVRSGVPSGPLAVDETTGLLYGSTIVADLNRIVVIDPATGLESVLSEDGDGMGPDFDTSTSKRPHISVDPVAGLLLAAVDRGSSDPDQLIGVDLLTGARSVLAEVGGSGTQVLDVCAVPGSGTAYLFETSAPAVWSVDLGTGAGVETTTTLPSVFTSQARMAIDVVGNRAFHLSRLSIDVIDLTTGASSVFSDGTGVPATLALVGTPACLQLDAANQRLVVVSAHEKTVHAVELAAGARSLEHDGGFGTGPLGRVAGVAVLDQDRILVTDERRHAIDRSQLDSAVRTTLSGDGAGSGPDVDYPEALAVAETNDTVYVINGESSLQAVDTTTGARHVVSSAAVGTGTPVDTWVDLVCSTTGRIFVLEEEEYWVLEIDPVTGDRTTLTGGAVGMGPDVGGSGLGLDPVTGTPYTCGNNLIVRVDLVTGDRTVFLDGNTALPGTPLRPMDLVFSPDGSGMFFTENNNDAVYRVDMSTQAITIVHDAAATPGFALRTPGRIASGLEAGIVFVLDHSFDAICAIDVTTGEAVVVAR